jgi:hypothetical protein
MLKELPNLLGRARKLCTDGEVCFPHCPVTEPEEVARPLPARALWGEPVSGFRTQLFFLDTVILVSVILCLASGHSYSS